MHLKICKSRLFMGKNDPWLTISNMKDGHWDKLKAIQALIECKEKQAITTVISNVLITLDC